jgi:hypothetical protein
VGELKGRRGKKLFRSSFLRSKIRGKYGYKWIGIGIGHRKVVINKRNLGFKNYRGLESRLIKVIQVLSDRDLDSGVQK